MDDVQAMTVSDLILALMAPRTIRRPDPRACSCYSSHVCPTCETADLAATELNRRIGKEGVPHESK